MAKNKEEKLGVEAALAELEKKNGLSVASKEDMIIVSSGSYTIDRATGLGGYPLGKIIELFGPESSGKSTILLHAIKSFQQAIPDKYVVLFDFEHSWDKRYAKSIGVDVDRVKTYQPDDQEQGYDMIVGLLEKELASLIMIDSHTAAIPKKVIEEGMENATMALQARNNSKFLGKIKGLLSKSNTTLMAVSQLRSDIGGMSNAGDKPTGGNGWKFYADIRFKIWKSLDKDNELNKTTLDVVKNKCEKPFGKAVFDIDWGTGINNYTEILDMAEEYNMVKRAGSWYSYGDVKLGQGSNGVLKLFSENDELYQEIKNKVLNYKEGDNEPAMAQN